MALPHPCVPVPAAEVRRILTAYHLALAALEQSQAPASWLDLPAATELTLRLMRPEKHTADAIACAQAAHAALHDCADGRQPAAHAVQACREFLPVFEALLRSVSWRRLIGAQRSMVADWNKLGCLPDLRESAG